MSDIEKRIGEELDAISRRGLTRKLNPPKGIDFSSNDYLGLANDKRLIKAFAEALEREGIGSTASRLLRGERRGFEAVEKQFADWKGSEASLYFATGYQANIGIFQALLHQGDIVFSDQLNHASIIDGLRLGRAEKRIYPHLDLEALDRGLSEYKGKGLKFVVTESLFSMDGDLAPLEEIAGITKRYGANLIVDEAHAVGVYGSLGSGLIEHFGVQEDVFLSVNTAGKALGVAGAFVAGSRATIDYLVNCCRAFIFSTAPLPASAAAIAESIEIIRTQPSLRRRLEKVKSLFAGHLDDQGLKTTKPVTHIVPVVVGESDRALKAAEYLQSKGFDVRAIRPPTVPEGTSRLRVSLNAKLTDRDLETFAVELAGTVKGIAANV